jgi:hypothetical protein
MKAILLLLALSGCATTAPDGVQITVSNAKAAQCQAAGGCGLLTLAQVLAMKQQAHDEGAAEAAAGLDSNGCKRGAM